MKNKSKFVPIEGDRYFFIDAVGAIRNYVYCEDNVDEWIIKHHRVFRTFEECEEYKCFIKTLDEYTFKPDWNNCAQRKWYPYFDHDEHRIRLQLTLHFQYQGICFEEFEKWNAFVKEVGEDAIKRFMFDIWE